MNVKDLIAELSKIEDKELEVRCVTPYECTDENPEDLDLEGNLWVQEIEVSGTGASGYEIHGEVRLLTNF